MLCVAKWQLKPHRQHFPELSIGIANTVRQMTKNSTTTTIEKVSKVINERVEKKSKIETVIQQTLKGSGDISSKVRLSADEALDAGMRFLGKNYKELGKSGSGVFRSADNLRQFRIDQNSLIGKHNPMSPHVHFEAFKPKVGDPYVNTCYSMNKEDIKIGVTGKILQGRHKGWFIYVEDDFKNTGGYLILVFNDLNRFNSSEGYDRWAEDKNILLEMFNSAQWKIQWLEDNPCSFQPPP
jgi:hypothetical protein